jgi:hypothetical protein
VRGRELDRGEEYEGSKREREKEKELEKRYKYAKGKVPMAKRER